MKEQSFRDLLDELAIEWSDLTTRDEQFSSVLEFLDDKGFDRDFYEKLNPDEIIHEDVRNEIGFLNIKNKDFLDARCAVLSGIKECYNFTRYTKDMTKDECDSYNQFEND